MFRDLYAVARHTPLHLIIAPNGEQLKIIVTPKPSGDAADNPALSKPFSAIGTPEELDAEFPAALKKYTEAVNDLRASINLPLDAFEDAKKKAAAKDAKKAEKERQEKEEAERRSAAAKQAAETRKQKAEQERLEKERKEKERAEAKEKKKLEKAAAKSGAGIQLPGGAAASTPASAAAEEKAAPKNGLPGKPECLADYKTLKAKHGDKLTRRLFIKKAKTGRRYEKLWKNWEAFVKEAEGQGALPVEPAAEPSAAAATSTDSAAGPATEGTAGDSIPAAAPAAAEPAAVPEPHKVVVLETASRKLLGMHSTEGLATGAVISLEGCEGAYMVDSFTPDAQILAHAVHEEPWIMRDEAGKELGRTRSILDADSKITIGNDEYTVIAARQLVGAEPAYTLRPVKPRFKVYLEGSDEAIGEFKWPPQVGERLDVDGLASPVRVVSLDGQRVNARQILAIKKALISTTGEKVGATDEIYEIADQVSEITDKEYRVVGIEETSYTVRAAKPHVKGPAASTAPVEA